MIKATKAWPFVFLHFKSIAESLIKNLSQSPIAKRHNTFFLSISTSIKQRRRRSFYCGNYVMIFVLWGVVQQPMKNWKGQCKKLAGCCCGGLISQWRDCEICCVWCDHIQGAPWDMECKKCQCDMVTGVGVFVLS